MTFSGVNAILYASLCGSLCFVLAFVYRRNGSRYKLIPSVVAFAVAAKAGAEWLDVMGSIVLYGYWPHIPPAMTLAMVALLAVAIHYKGNMARILGCLSLPIYHKAHDRGRR